MDDYFESTSPPPNLTELTEKINNFVDFHKSHRKIAIVSSGGTTVPLEANTVRFLDNFSAGTRGAISAENFLEAGYAVIFFHRQFSLQPYSRHFTHSLNCFLDYLIIDDDCVKVEDQWCLKMKDVLIKYQKAKSDQTLLMITFVSVRDYLFILQAITKILSKIDQDALFYLAAAVSDFFVPDNKMVHTINQDFTQDPI